MNVKEGGGDNPHELTNSCVRWDGFCTFFFKLEGWNFTCKSLIPWMTEKYRSRPYTTYLVYLENNILEDLHKHQKKTSISLSISITEPSKHVTRTLQCYSFHIWGNTPNTMFLVYLENIILKHLYKQQKSSISPSISSAEHSVFVTRTLQCYSFHIWRNTTNTCSWCTPRTTSWCT